MLNSLLATFGRVSELVLFSTVLIFALGNFVRGGAIRQLNGSARKLIQYVGNVEAVRKGEGSERKYKTKAEA
jgi:hypothetical protein